MRVQHSRQPPDIAGLLSVLDRHAVRYVLVGSVAALAYGAEIGEPGDLDITPALDRQNLTRLRAVLDDIVAGPEADAPFGHWEPRPDGERRWIVDETTPELLAQRANWRPDPGDPRTFDTLLCSRLGSFDIVPELGGTYDTLMKRAVRLRVWEHDLWVVHLDELLAALTVPRRPKDVPRVRQLRAIQRVRGEQARAQTGDERGAI